MEIKVHGKYGGITIVDKQDYELVSSYKWLANCKGYVRSYNKGKEVYLHRLLLNAPKGMEVDHLNHDPKDNRRSNLRLCSHLTNMDNMRGTGVAWDSQKRRWRATFMRKGKMYRLGWFKDKAEAAKLAQETKEMLRLQL